MGSLWFEAVKFYVYTRDHPPPHVHARYAEIGLFWNCSMALKTGQRLAISQEDLQEIAGANPADLTDVEILGGGTALNFGKIMEGVEVDALRRGSYGSQRWMDGLAQRRRERLQQAS